LCAALAARHDTHSERLRTDVAGLAMRSPLGLAAGFDKSARAVRLLATLGFGHLEVGSISAERSRRMSPTRWASMRSSGAPRPREKRVQLVEGA
jgi:dihydroorotate dehydrogenase